MNPLKNKLKSIQKYSPIISSHLLLGPSWTLSPSFPPFASSLSRLWARCGPLYPQLGNLPKDCFRISTIGLSNHNRWFVQPFIFSFLKKTLHLFLFFPWTVEQLNSQHAAIPSYFASTPHKREILTKQPLIYFHTKDSEPKQSQPLI